MLGSVKSHLGGWVRGGRRAVGMFELQRLMAPLCAVVAPLRARTAPHQSPNLICTDLVQVRTSQRRRVTRFNPRDGTTVPYRPKAPPDGKQGLAEKYFWSFQVKH